MGFSAKKEKSTKKEKSAKKEGRNLRDRVRKEFNVYLPTPEWAEQRLESSGSEFWKPSDGKNLILMAPSLTEGRLSPWIETSGHYLGGPRVLELLKISERPEDLPLVQGCIKFHKQKRCGNCQLSQRLKKSSNSAERALGAALYAGLECFAYVIDLRTKASRQRGWQPYKFAWTIAKALASAIESGRIFCDPRNLLIIKIRKTTKRGGYPDYGGSEVTTKSFGPAKKAWIEQLQELPPLEDYIHPCPTTSEISQAHEILLGTATAADSAVDDFGADGDYDDDDIPF